MSIVATRSQQAAGLLLLPLAAADSFPGQSSCGGGWMHHATKNRALCFAKFRPTLQVLELGSSERYGDLRDFTMTATRRPKLPLTQQ